MIHVIAVKYAGGLSLSVEFDDDTSGIADLSALFQRAAVFAPLRDPELFRRAYVDDGAVCWPGDLDLTAARVYALVHDLPVPDTLEQANANELAMRARDHKYLSVRPPRQ
jgi:Protein of unknown function (DUF2442)